MTGLRTDLTLDAVATLEGGVQAGDGIWAVQAPNLRCRTAYCERFTQVTLSQHICGPADALLGALLMLLLQHPSRTGSCERPVSDRGDAVHEDVHHPLGVVVRIRVGGYVAYRIEVENHHVGRSTCA